MCCSRSHYPTDVGAWQCDSFAAHVHIGDRYEILYDTTLSPGDKGYDIGLSDTTRYLEGNLEAYPHHDDDFHIVLPGGGLVCVGPWAIRVNHHQIARSRLHTVPMDARRLVALAVAEGGRMDAEYLAFISKRTEYDHGVTLDYVSEGAWVSDTPDIMLPPAVQAPSLDYATWLAAQRESETRLRLGI